MNKGQPTSILIDGEISNDPNKIANGFNNYFSNVAGKLQGKILSVGKEFSNFLKTPNENFFLFESADSQEILLIIDSFDNNKSSGPNSIPTDVLKLIKNILCQLPFKRNHFNLSFTTGRYPTQLKLAKVITTFKNKGDLYLCSQMLIKYLRELSTKDYILFSTNTIVSMNFNLVFELSIQPTMLCLAEKI